MTTQPQSGLTPEAIEALLRAKKILDEAPCRSTEMLVPEIGPQSGAAMEPTQAEARLMLALLLPYGEGKYDEHALALIRQHVAYETAELRKRLTISEAIRHGEKKILIDEIAKCAAQAAQIDAMRAKLQDIHVTAHCISKAGPLNTPTLDEAWSKFDRIACMAVSALAATTLGGDEKNAGKTGQHTSDSPLIGSDPLSGAADQRCCICGSMPGMPSTSKAFCSHCGNLP